MDKRNKILIIGLDGASFNTLFPLIKEGRLPNLKLLLETGSHGVLESTLPTNSFTAWASFMTGKNPGKHGIYDFRKRTSSEPINKMVVNSTFLTEETIFEIISRNDLKVGSINMPLTYPPSKIDGFMISGILIPKVSKEMFHPPLLYQELISQFGKYHEDVKWSFYKNRINSLIKDLSSMTEKRSQIFIYLMKKYQWDVLAVVFVGTDRIQHALLKYLDPKHSQYNKLKNSSQQEKIKNYFSLIDDKVGKIISQAGEDTTVIITSDHGFHPCEKQFKINQFLNEIQMLEFNKKRSKVFNIIKKLDIPSIRRIRRKLIPNIEKHSNLFKVFGNINWHKTKAYSFLDIEQGISINLRGREPYGIVEPGEEYRSVRNHIKGQLLYLREPEHGKKVIKNVYFKEEIFHGDQLSEAPDMIIEPEGDIFLGRESNTNFGKLKWASGDHDRDGVLIMRGRGIKKNVKLLNAKLIDVAPTVLYLAGVPIPKEMDGKVLCQVLSDDFLKAHPIVIEKNMDRSEKSKKALGLENGIQKELEKKLKGLGYLD